LISLLLVGFIGFKGIAQHSQGNISVGGTFNLQFTTNKTESSNNSQTTSKVTSFTLLPSAEYFIANDLSLGLGIGYTLSRTKDETHSTYEYIYTERRFILNPYVRKYWGLGDRASIFAQASLTYGFGKDIEDYKYSNTTTTYKYDASQFSLGISPGVQLQVSGSIALEAAFGFVGYTHESVDTGSNSSASAGSVIFNLDPSTLQFGIRYTLK
jgi:hypothetical protein